ncbi:hypothetical protein Rrhod_2909 [Rhodococcus rhodnii LMG 5362]|uniref:Uncharacterized protein n=2 Tax=Rhodococcus rhodnii TaxID=38312 RepID=R7WKB1_9NOCA|nr:hypothetical protein Rrhod_2909 [Rhodococcus rhodnii LMG 5362]
MAATLALLGGGIASAQDQDPGSPDGGASGSLSSTSFGSSGNPVAEPLTFDGWNRCPVAGQDFGTCVTVIVRGGQMKIGGLDVPIPDGSLKVSGGVNYVEDGNDWKDVFVPDAGTNFGVTSTPITIPGGAFGIDTPLNLTQIQATVEAVGTPTVNVLDANLSMPVRLKLQNKLLGNNCYLGSPTNPVTLNLASSGNPRSQPIGGGTVGAVFPATPHTDTTFAVPAATGCGPLGSLNWAVNLRAGTPSPTGRNSLTATSDVYNVAAYEVAPS